MFRHVFASTLLLILLCANSPAQHHDDDHELHFSHPLIVESPSPDSKVRLDYFYMRNSETGETTSDHTPRIEAEYAFKRTFSIEINLPYTFRRSDVQPYQSHLDTIEVSFKFASFALKEHHILPTYGLSFELPTGNRSGIGSNHVLNIEPFAGVGYKRKKLELIGIGSVGFPVNKRTGEEEGTEFGFGAAALYKVNHHIQPLIEFDSHRVLSGPEQGRTEINISPAIKFLPPNDHWQIGIGAGFPVTSDHEFKVRTVISVFYHFD